MSHTINVTDLTDQDAVLRVLSDIRSHGASYALVQDGIEVAKVVPAEIKKDYNGKVSAEVIKKRQEVMKRIDERSKRIAELWNTDENAAEVVANNRRYTAVRHKPAFFLCELRAAFVSSVVKFNHGGHGGYTARRSRNQTW